MISKNEAGNVTMVNSKKEEGEYVRINPLKITVLDSRVLCKVVDFGHRTSGGIVLPRTTQMDKALTILKVISVGDGRKTEHGVHIKVRVNPGDYVIVGKFAGQEVGGKDYKILNEVEILGIQDIGNSDV
jgi:chaperonin GroES